VIEIVERSMAGFAKQSISPRKGSMDCFAARLLQTAFVADNDAERARNDGERAVLSFHASRSLAITKERVGRIRVNPPSRMKRRVKENPPYSAQ